MSEFKLIPYTTVDGIWTLKDSTVINLYNQSIEEGFYGLVFFDGLVQNSIDFLKRMKDPRFQLIVCVDENRNAIAYGALQNITKTSAELLTVFFREVWGRPDNIEIGKEFHRMVFEGFSLEVITAYIRSSNIRAVKFAQKFGYVMLGEIPKLFWSVRENVACDTTVLYLTREEFERCNG
jgi:RimJ/RimL family protein N-acetyltransferase